MIGLRIILSYLCMIGFLGTGFFCIRDLLKTINTKLDKHEFWMRLIKTICYFLMAVLLIITSVYLYTAQIY